MNTAESAMMADCGLKNMELGARQQQQQQPPQESDAVTINNNLAEAVAVRVLDGHPQQAQGGVVIEHHYVLSSPAPSVRMNNKGDIQCCYAITIDDPVEVENARKVALAHVFAEIVGDYLFCASAWCGAMLSLAMWSSGLVACCFKTRIGYLLWSLAGGVLFVSHAIVAIEAFLRDPDEYFFTYWPPVIVFFAQITLCGVSLHVAHTGRKTASVISRQSICPVETQIGTPPFQLPTHHPVVAGGVQQHPPVIRMLP